jgi:hypothetical protein
MTNIDPRLAPFIKEHEKATQTFIESRMLQKIVDQFIENINDAIHNELPCPETDDGIELYDDAPLDFEDYVFDLVVKQHFTSPE